MKFAILSALPLDPPRGGAEVVAARMAEGLRNSGHLVTVATRAIMIRSMVAGADWVITHNVRGLGWLLPRRIRRLGLQHVHVLHDVQLIEPSGLAFDDLRPTLVRRVWAALMRWIWGSPAVVIGPSQWILDVHREWGFFPKSKLVHLPNPAQTHRTNHEFVNKKSPRFLFIGQIEPHKGVFDLFEAARSLPPDVRVEYIGDGSALPELKRRAAGDPRFILRGRVRPDDIPALLIEANAVVVPSRCLENAPLTITDALAAGIPVIATRVGGIPELVRDGENGQLVPPGDVPALVQALFSARDHRDRPAPPTGRDSMEYIQRLTYLLSF